MTIWQTIKKYPTALVWAFVIHIVAFVAIVMSFKSADPKISAVKQEKVIEAVAIDEKKIKAEINKLKKDDARKKQEQKRLQDKARKAKKERQKEEKKLRALKKKQKEQEQINKKKQIAEKKRLAQLEKDRIAQEQQEKIRLKKLSDLEKKEQERKAQLEREEKQRKEKIEKKKQQEQEEKRRQQELNEIGKYTGLINAKVSRNWIYLDSYGKDLKCIIQIQLLPSGDVINAKVIKSSGNIAFDRSAELAALKASPLPVPKDTDLFQREFRTVNLDFEPTK